MNCGFVIMREGTCTQVKDLVMVDVTIACNARVMLAVIMLMYPSDKHGRGADVQGGC